MRLKILLLLISIAAFNQSMAATSVGTAPLGTPPGSGICDYATIQGALDSGATNINVLNDEVFEENILIDHAVEIVGGFATCQDANFNLVPTEINTKIKGTDILGESVVRIETDDNPTIKLINLTLQSAAEDVSVQNGGHGLKIDESNGEIWLINSNIGLNNSDLGAGIFMKNSNEELSVVLENSSVSFNTANSNGGGVYCSGVGTNLYVFEDSFIGVNTATNGGGIYAESDCYVIISSGVDVHTNSTFRGLMYNNASIDGGGIYADSSRIRLDATMYGYPGSVLIRDSDSPVTVAKNSAGHDGGGIFTINGSNITVKDGLIEGNTAGNNGGGFYVGSDLDVSGLGLGISNRACWNEGACMEISNNKAHLGGVFYLKGTAAFNTTNASISGNRADIGTVGYADEEESAIAISGSYLYNNGNNGIGDYTDNYVLRILNNSALNLGHSTLADNDINASSAIIGSVQSDITLRNSIIHNAETVLEVSDPISIVTSCLIVNEDISVSGPNVYMQNPGFVDANNQNYHIHSNSNAIDLCENHPSTPNYDSDGDPRVWDEPFVENVEGSLDAGADEYFVDNIFKSSFEDI